MSFLVSFESVLTDNAIANQCWSNALGEYAKQHFLSVSVSLVIWHLPPAKWNLVAASPTIRVQSPTTPWWWTSVVVCTDLSGKEPDRQNETKAVVESMADLSPTVKGVTFRVANKALRFMSGQWVDLMVTGVDTVGGFSMSSSPHVLEERQQLDLAIKASSHPPAHWAHTQCRVGSEVTLRVGGSIFYAPPAGTPAHSLLLIAGGVGVNPLYSILQHAVHERSGTKVTVMCTARTGEELLFREQIEQIAAASSDVIKCQFFVTRQNEKKDKIGVKYGRIGKAEVVEAVRVLQQGGTPVTSYLCGPGSMISTMKTYLQQVGLAQSHILYEKW